MIDVQDEPTAPADAPTSRADDNASDFPVVGIGASAGGLEALSRFLDAMAADTGLAFVIVHHTDPNHESLMVELLAKHTTMPVSFADDGMSVVPNHVYVIRPNSYLALRNGTLRQTAPEARRGMRLPIDFFLRSLASAQRERAIAIILSGTGNDGALGVSAVKENGGIVIAQEPEEAGHDGMPRSAIATSAVDQVLKVPEIAVWLDKYSRHPYVKNGGPPTVLGDRARSSLADIISFLKTQTPINFKLYKEGTLLRRIERRMGLHHIEDAAQYLSFLRDHRGEAAQLCKDLLISVTSFFRDPAAFEDLAQNVIPELLKKHPAEQPFRAWVAGCATGEEAYSIAMLLIEQASALRKDVKIQVFASDIDGDALADARDGRYPSSIEADVSAARLGRFFTKEDHSFHVTPELRETIIFAKQNLLSEPPFSKLDIISCRNVLIYLNPGAQERLIATFHFALNEGGVLMLGSSETIGAKTDQFQPISPKHRIFGRIGRSHFGYIGYPMALATGSPSTPAAPRLAESPRPVSLSDLSQRLLLDHYAPAAVLINDEFDVLYFHGATDRYLRIPPGEPRHTLPAMAREELQGELGAAIREARQRRQKVARSATVRRDDQNSRVAIIVHPTEEQDKKLMLVTFVDQPATEHMPSSSPEDATAVHLLEQELASTKQELRSTISDLEGMNEELKAANEEAMSMNEEFQSTNEELETSKEELQSLNEELTTLNAQLQHKITEERALSDDLNNLLTSSDIATIFLDTNLNIKRYTPQTNKLFGLIATDVGRPMADISPRVEDPELLEDARKVLADLIPMKREVKGRNGTWYNRRILPYRTSDNKVSGVVITFADVTDLKVAESQAKAAQVFSQNIINTLHEPLIVLGPDMRIRSASAAFYRKFSSRAEDCEGRSFFEVANRQWDSQQLRLLLERVIPERLTIEDYRVTHDFHHLGRRTLLLNARGLQGSDGTDAFCLLAIEDITKRHANLLELEDREANLRSTLGSVLATVPDAIITINEHGIVDSFNEAAAKLFGFTAAEIIGKNVNVLMPEPQSREHDGYVARYLKTGEAKIIGRGREVIGQRKDGSTVPLRLSVAELKYADRRRFVGILHDLTEEQKLRDAYQQSQKMHALGHLAGGVAHDFNNLLTIVIGNNELLKASLDNDKQRGLLDQATSAAELGAGLTRRLLSFARRSKLEPTVLCINDHVRGTVDLLRRTLGEAIDLKTEIARDLWLTRIDPGEFENALVNLAVNARDAMPEGGTLTIKTENATVGQDRPAALLDLAPGDYVRVSVVDTGIGMAPDVLKHAAEPFFTTKAPSKGTGLGLASAHGFAEQSGGALVIASEVGLGTAVTFFLPRAHEEEPQLMRPAKTATMPLGNGELVLVVDDNDQVRDVTLKRLESLGYTVMEASNGPEAIECLKSEPEIALVLTDIVMPGGMSGHDLAAEARKLSPDIKILLASGYDTTVLPGEAARLDSFTTLQKPYTREKLALAMSQELSG